MKRILAKLSLLGLLLVLGSEVLLGQEDQPLTFRVLGYGSGLFEGIQFEDDEGEAVELEFVPNRKSRVYRVSRDRRSLELFREEESERTRNLVRVPIAEIVFPEKMEAATFVLVGRETFEEVAEGFEVFAFDESTDAWGPGCFRFLNLTPAELACTMAGQRILLPPGPSPVIRYEGERGEAFLLSLFVRYQGEAKVVYSIHTQADPNYGKLLVIKPPLKEGELKVRVENLW